MTTHFDEAADRIIDAAAGRSRVLLSRALHPELRHALAGRWLQLVELPHISGKTVIPADVGADDLVVLGHPNYLGRFDDQATAVHHFVVVDGTCIHIRDLPAGADTVVIGSEADPGAALRSRDQARLLVKHMRQVKGVREAFMPTTPIAILLLPVDPTRVAARIDRAWVRALSVDYPEFPGGLRVEFPSGIDRDEEHAYAASIREAIATVAKG